MRGSDSCCCSSRLHSEGAIPVKPYAENSALVRRPPLRLEFGGQRRVQRDVQAVVDPRLLRGQPPDGAEQPIGRGRVPAAVSYTHLRAHETKANLVCRLLLEKKKKKTKKKEKCLFQKEK